MSNSPSIVYVVDDDPVSTEGLQRIILTAGLKHESFNAGGPFLAAYPKLQPGCIFVELVMPGMSGLELLQKLRAAGCHWPMVAVAGPGNMVSAADAVHAGAFAFLEKPVRELEVLALVRKAQAYLNGEAEALYDKKIAARLQRLSNREREVLACVLQSRLNKQTAAELGISESTVKSARRTLMQRMQATSSRELILLALRGGVTIKSRS